MKTQLQLCACALILSTGPIFAAAPIPTMDPVVFEQRFHKADKDKNGKLSRAEAYAEFPRMPEFFDERERLAHMEAPALEAVQRLEGLADADLIK